VTPNLEPRSIDLSIEYVNEVSGLKLTAKQIADLLPKAGYDVEEVDGDRVSVLVPNYRVDVMHAVDLVEDVMIAYGYNNIKPLWRRPPTTGALRPEQRLLDVARELMIGLGFQEILTYALTNHDSLFAKMKMRKQPVVEIANPKVQTMTCLRSWLLPSLMEFLSFNTSVEYPQRIFELDKVTLLDKKAETRTRDEDWLAAVVSHPTASFSEIKSDLDSFFMNLGVEWRIKETKHPSFIEGRVAEALVGNRTVGIVGEINPEVLSLWKLENPTAAFELNMEKYKQKDA
jgi:phenylalanyl-tRNA synthetase beta chain